jgi:hypothetical protein
MDRLELSWQGQCGKISGWLTDNCPRYHHSQMNSFLDLWALLSIVMLVVSDFAWSPGKPHIDCELRRRHGDRVCVACRPGDTVKGDVCVNINANSPKYRNLEVQVCCIARKAE